MQKKAATFKEAGDKSYQGYEEYAQVLQDAIDWSWEYDSKKSKVDIPMMLHENWQSRIWEKWGCDSEGILQGSRPRKVGFSDSQPQGGKESQKEPEQEAPPEKPPDPPRKDSQPQRLKHPPVLNWEGPGAEDPAMSQQLNEVFEAWQAKSVDPMKDEITTEQMVRSCALAYLLGGLTLEGAKQKVVGKATGSLFNTAKQKWKAMVKNKIEGLDSIPPMFKQDNPFKQTQLSTAPAEKANKNGPTAGGRA
jgi:hypothetical protein